MPFSGDISHLTAYVTGFFYGICKGGYIRSEIDFYSAQIEFQMIFRFEIRISRVQIGFDIPFRFEIDF